MLGVSSGGAEESMDLVHIWEEDTRNVIHRLNVAFEEKSRTSFWLK